MKKEIVNENIFKIACIIIGILFTITQFFAIRTIEAFDKKFDDFGKKINSIVENTNNNSKNISNLDIKFSYLEEDVKDLKNKK